MPIPDYQQIGLLNTSPLMLAFDPIHVGVRQAKVVADFVDQHVADDVAEILSRIGAILQDRAPIKEDHIDVLIREGDAFAVERYALIQPQQVIGALQAHLPFDVGVGKFGDADDHVDDMAAKFNRQSLKRGLGDGVNIVQARGMAVAHINSILDPAARRTYVTPMATKLTSEELNDAVGGLDDWTKVDGRDAIEKTFKFADFGAAFAFMTEVAAKADAMDHHPEWFNVYSTVKVTLATHDAGGVTGLDIELAKFMDAAA